MGAAVPPRLTSPQGAGRHEVAVPSKARDGATPRTFLRGALLTLLAVLFTATACARGSADGTVALADLPPEAVTTLQLIEQGGPFPYSRDGVVFGNYERMLPQRPRGYYHEYTVPTPRLNHRGARRIVTGREGERYYTADHYRTFRRIRE